MRDPIDWTRVCVGTVDHRGREYDRFYTTRSQYSGPGWYVYGRNPEYGDTLVRLVARPNVPYRRHKWYNCPVRRGWATKREAQAIADAMNRGEHNA